MQKRLIAHVDMDCFYAAAEIKKTPSLGGIPLIIGADKNSPRGVVCTASYEARKFGVKSAMPISQAVRLCPDGVFLRPDFFYYTAQSKLIMETLQSLIPSDAAFEQLSVDEANLDVTDLLARFETFLNIGKYIRSQIFETTGFSCSVGVSYSRKVAKIAAGYKKPHGVTAVFDMKSFLAPMSIGAIPGIGKKSVPYFTALSIKTIGDFAKKDKFFVLEKFGRVGFEHWILANGEDYSTIMPRGEEQSFSREETYMDDILGKHLIANNLQSLSKKVFEDLGTFSYKTVTLKIRYSDFTTITRSISLKFACNSQEQIIQAAKNLASNNLDYSRPIRLLGIKLSNLSHANQTSLLDFRNQSGLIECESLQLQKESAPNIM